MSEQDIKNNLEEEVIDENLEENEEKSEDIINEEENIPEEILHSPSFEETEDLVKQRITWFRKWTKDIPNYIHSFHVREILKENRFNETVQIAGLLHDIVEDWNTTFDELRELWYPEEVIKLVDLATHNLKTKDKFQRWKDMMKRLEEACDRNARAIKLADICDNVSGCHTMPNLKKRKRFLYEKCPYFVEQWNKWFWWTEFYLEFLRRYHKQLFNFVTFEKRLAAWKVLWILIWISFILTVWLGCYAWYKTDVSLMKLSLTIGIGIVILMWILHIICFRIPHKTEY